MKTNNNNYVSLTIWIISLVLIGSLIGSLTKAEVNNWYANLSHPPLTPPNYVFPIVWTILYIMIAICGWLIWQQKPRPNFRLTKILYISQLILNWSWTPIFFYFHLTGVSLICLVAMDFIVLNIIYLEHKRIKLVSILMTIYLVWILFATYLNLYIWLNLIN